MKRILVIRGGALGDFILTLPALKALRDAHSGAHIEILAYKHIAAIADKRYYADAVRSIEYGALSTFFARGAELPLELRDHFAGFDLILSYLYDPDRIFEENLRRCGADNILFGPAKILPGAHASTQLARPLQQLGINISDFAARLFPSSEDQQFAGEFLECVESPILAIHPGSGSEQKNWPLPNWIELVRAVLDTEPKSTSGCFHPADEDPPRRASHRHSFRTILIVSGEADQSAMHRLQKSFEDEERLRFADQLPLPHLAAVLSQCTFIGHDSGISHLAAATGARSILLFGPTDPKIWAPQNNNVEVLLAPNGELSELAVTRVRDAI